MPAGKELAGVLFPSSRWTSCGALRLTSEALAMTGQKPVASGTEQNTTSRRGGVPSCGRGGFDDG